MFSPSTIPTAEHSFHVPTSQMLDYIWHASNVENLLKKPLVFYWALRKDPFRLGIQDKDPRLTILQFILGTA